MSIRRSVITLEEMWTRYNINRRMFYDVELQYTGTDNDNYLFRRKSKECGELSGLVTIPCRVVDACLKGRAITDPIKVCEIVRNLEEVRIASRLGPENSYSRPGMITLHEASDRYRGKLTVTLYRIGPQETEGQEYHIFRFYGFRTNERLLVSAELTKGIDVSDGTAVYFSQLVRKYDREPAAEDARTVGILAEMERNPLQGEDRQAAKSVQHIRFSPTPKKRSTLSTEERTEQRRKWNVHIPSFRSLRKPTSSP